MKQRIFKQKWLFLVLAVLLLIPAGFTLAKYAETRDVGMVTLDIQANSPTVLAGDVTTGNTWQYQLWFNPTALVFDSYDNHAATLGMTWGQGRNVGEVDEYDNFTDGVKLFIKDTTAYILAKGSNSVTFPRNSAYLLASPDSSDNIMQDVTSITFGNIDTSNTTIMTSMFNNCSALKDLDLSKFNTANVTNMRSMFNGCEALETLDLSSFNTEKLKNISAMFQSCTALKTLNISSFNTEKVTDMSYLFNGCSNLNQLDLSRFNTEKVANMSFLFNRCSNLKQLDLSGFNTQSVTSATNMQRMFNGCSKLEEVTLGTNFKFVGTNGYLPAQTNDNIPGADGKWYIDSATGFSPEEVATHQATVTEATTYNAVKVNPPAAEPILDNGWKEQLGGNIVDVIIVDSYNNQADYLFNNREGRTWDDGVPVGQKVNGSFTDGVKLFYWEDIYADGAHALILAEGDQAVVFPEDSSELFKDVLGSTLTRVRAPASAHFYKFDTSGVKNMSYMFSGWSRLGMDIDFLNKFDTSRVTDMSYMFSGCSSFTRLDLSSFDTRMVENMSCMFEGCDGLQMVTLGERFIWPDNAEEDSWLPTPLDSVYDCWYNADGDPLDPIDIVESQKTAKGTTTYYASTDIIP